MYITEVTKKDKSGNVRYRTVLLRESYRENGKVKNRTIANLTNCKPEEIEAIRIALEYKGDLTVLGSHNDGIELNEGKSVGAVWLLYDVAKRLGIENALGKSRNGKLALWQVMARLLDQGSRLSAVRLASVHAATDVLSMTWGFDENDLYDNLSWLNDNQRDIEKRLFLQRHKGAQPNLFLYDVTSSYFEGLHNELSDYGYNRDQKKGKKQVILGLLCDEGGDPVSVEVFRGNTNDFNTFGGQIEKIAQLFGCKQVTFVGDRGMIKSAQIEMLKDRFQYITAITKSQIDKLLKDGVFQIDLFDENICEVLHEGVRYILRRNMQRQKEIAHRREDRIKAIENDIEIQNIYLKQHGRAKVSTAVKKIEDKIARFRLQKWLSIEVEERVITLHVDEDMKSEQTKLDGCYVIKSDVPVNIDKDTIHDRYKDLSKVEQAFRTMKTTFLEMRPWYVRTEKSTRGHALVVMLAYHISRYLEKQWVSYDLTVQEGLAQLSTLSAIQMNIADGHTCNRIPKPRETSEELLDAADVHLPKVLPNLGARVVTRKKLPSQRISD